ncbi:MAG: ABC transporter permease [Chloroflexi bacterium]|nr:MAG: ABC transporter permease [Chloroflexota bacterium]
MVRRSLSFGSVSAGRLSGGALLRQVALLALLLVTVGFWIYFSVAASGFTSDFNLFSLLRFAAIQITIGFAQMVALSIGDLNLAVGAIGGATAMIAGWAMQFLGLPPLVAVLFALAAGTLLGFGNALLITWTRINSFIVTLATASLITGAMLIITHSDPFSRLPDSFTSFSETEVAGLPVFFCLYRNLSLGREMLAVGANRRAARMSGLSVDRVVLFTHGISGGLAATAGLMAIAADHTASPSLGSDWLLASFVAPAIGGTLLSGGLVSVPGTIVGGVLLATISNGLLLVGIDNFWITVFLGAILLLAVVLDRVTRAAGGAGP